MTLTEARGQASRMLRSRGVRNGAWLYLLQFFNTVVPLVTLPYVTRVLGASGYGVFSIALNVVGYFQVVVEYGFGMSATRKVATEETGDGGLDGLFSRVLCARVLLTAACVLASTVMLVAMPAGQGACVCVMGVSCLGYCVQQNWLFQGRQDMRLISVVNIVGRTVSTALVFLMVRSEADVLLYSVLWAVSPLLSGLAGLLAAARRYSLRFVLPTMREVLAELRDGFFVFTTQLSSKVFGAAGVTVLGAMCAPEVVGTYAAIQRIPSMLLLLWTPVSQVLYPMSSERMARSEAEGLRFVFGMRRVFLGAFALIAVVVGLAARPVVAIAFGEAYAARWYWTLPLLAWLVVAINNNFLGIQSLLASGRDMEYSRCFQVGVAATVAFNLVLVFVWGGDGAAVAPLASEVVLWLMLRREVVRMGVSDGGDEQDGA